MLYLAQEKPEQALQDAQRAHEVDATSLTAYYILGKAYFALENYPQAPYTTTPTSSSIQMMPMPYCNMASPCTSSRDYPPR